MKTFRWQIRKKMHYIRWLWKSIWISLGKNKYQMGFIILSLSKNELNRKIIIIIQQIYLKMAISRKTQYILPPLREKIDHYSYLGKESIGKGFSSSVFKGRDDHTEEQVAIKIIDMKAMKGQIHKNLLTSQIEILSLIKNKPNLLDVHKICTEKNKTYIITDFCEGGDLGKLIKAKKKLSENEAVKIVKQIIKGYEGLYSLGIVHRDLKPANIFFHNSHLEIGDFGFAVKQENLRLTQKYNVGSPVYMPPEALNYNKYSHKSDIWAIGVIFYEMLTGTTPWTGRTENELKTKLKTISIRNIMPPSISKASSLFLRKTLETDVTRRMEPYEMFQHFDRSHQNEDDEQDSYSNLPNNRLFRSMRKPARSELFDQTRGQSLKKTTNALLLKKVSNLNPQSMHSTNYVIPAPKTAIQLKGDKDYSSAIQKRMISKHLLSQIHFCRFLYKLISNIKAGLSLQISTQLQREFIQLLFYKLKETKQLRLVNNEIVQQYLKCSDYVKLQKLVDEYVIKYTKKLGKIKEQELPTLYSNEMYQGLVQDIVKYIKILYEFVSKSYQPNYLIKQIIVLDYLITITQLLQLVRIKDIEMFHNKSKIQTIVDGESITQVSMEHVRMIGNKLRVLKII